MANKIRANRIERIFMGMTLWSSGFRGRSVTTSRLRDKTKRRATRMPGRREGIPYPLAYGMCYNATRRGASREAVRTAASSRAGERRFRVLAAADFRVVVFRVAGGGRFALLSRVLAKAGISPVQADLQSVRLLHVLRRLRLAPQAQAAKRKQGSFRSLVCCSAPDLVAAGLLSRVEGLSKE